LNDDKYDDDDDVNVFVFHFVLKNKIILYLLIHLEHILVHLMFDEYLNQFVQINQQELNEELNILDLNQYHIYHLENDLYWKIEVHHNYDRLSKFNSINKYLNLIFLLTEIFAKNLRIFSDSFPTKSFINFI
jgi:hypothetical protein